jgi:hypothetical protein
VRGQSVSISTLTAQDGSSGSILLKIESPAGKAPVALQWDFWFPPSIAVEASDLVAGSAAESAEKTLACKLGTEPQPGGETVCRCILYGGRKSISNGVMAMVHYRVNPTAAKKSRRVSAQSILAVDADANPISIASAEATLAAK